MAADIICLFSVTRRYKYNVTISCYASPGQPARQASTGHPGLRLIPPIDPFVWAQWFCLQACSGRLAYSNSYRKRKEKKQRP